MNYHKIFVFSIKRLIFHEKQISCLFQGHSFQKSVFIWRIFPDQQKKCLIFPAQRSILNENRTAVTPFGGSALNEPGSGKERLL